MTWNVQHSSPARARAQVAWLAARDDADVLVLSEVCDSPGGRELVAALLAHGYRVVAPRPTGDRYLVVVASRVGEIQPCGIELDHLPARFVSARLDIGSHVVGLVGVYVPSRGPVARRNHDKRSFQRAVAETLPGLAERLGCAPIVVAGDLNVVEPGHSPHYPVFSDWEYSFYGGFAEHDLVDAFRAQHPAAVEHSWFGRGGNGYRFDHIFVTREQRDWITDCCYVHEPRLAGLSDHAAMTVALAPSGAQSV